MDFSQFVARVSAELPPEIQKPITDVVETGLTLAPILGKLYHSYQHKKINNALRDMSSTLESITLKLEANSDSVIFKEEVFPIIVGKIITEPQEEKIKIIIDGFEHFIDRKITDLDFIFYYYDVLEELRISDITFLSEEYLLPQTTGLDIHLRVKLKEPKVTKERSHYEGIEKMRERETFATYTKNKLQKLGLIQENHRRSKRAGQVDRHGKVSSVTNIVFELSPFGKDFCEFFLKNEL